MVSEDAFRDNAPRGAAVDQLLEEYLRVINDKDDQLHRLLRQLEELQAGFRERDEVHKARLKDTTRRLQRSAEQVKTLQEQCAHSEALNGKLVQHSESLKMQLRSSEAKAQELTTSTAQMADRIQKLEEDAAALRSTLSVLATQREKDREAMATRQQLLSAEQSAMAALPQQCQTLGQTVEDRQTQEGQPQTQLQAMLPRSEHVEVVKALESAAAAARAHYTRDLDQLQQGLRRKEEEAASLQQSLRGAQDKIAELTDALQSTSTTLRATRQELSTAAAAAQQTEKELREELSRRKVVQQELTERVAEVERALARARDAAQRSTAESHTAQLQHERYKAATEATLEAGTAQLQTAQERLRQAQTEADAARRQLETAERAAAENGDAAARLREQQARAEADAREKIAALTAALSASKDDCNRLNGELKAVQSELKAVQCRTTDDERTLNRKFEELQLAVGRLQTQLRDKEEETRRLQLVHSSELQKVKHENATTAEEARRRHEAEVRDLSLRIERFRAGLGEQTGGSKSLEKELQHLEETRREMRREVDRLQSLLENKDVALQSCKKEMERQQGEVAQLTQQLALREKAETLMRQQLEEAVRVQLDWKTAAAHAQDTAAALKKTAESTTASCTAVEAQLSKRDAAITKLRREIEELQEERQAAVRETMQQKTQREQLAMKLSGAEGRLASCEIELRDAAQEYKKLQRALDECKAEMRRAQDATDQRDAECARLTKHAAEAEALAQRTSEELQRTVEAREDVIRQLRAEQATVLPQLNEERSRLLVLQERLQHQQEVSRRDIEAAEERARASDGERAAREADVAALQVEKAHLEQQLSDATAQIESLTASLEGREHKYQQRKEEVQKALSQVEEVKAAAAATLQEAEVQNAAANALRDKYRREKAKMEALLQRMELKVRDAAKGEKEGRQREQSLAEKLAEAEAALRRVQDSFESRLGETKLHCEEVCRQHEESFREAAHDAQAAEKQARALQTQLLEAQRRATAAESSHRELQRRLAASQMLAVEEYAEEVTEMKRACVDALLRAHYAMLAHASVCLFDGWAAAQRTVDSSRLAMAEMERRLARTEARHADALQAMDEAQARQREAAAAEYREEVARLKREAAEAERRLAAEAGTRQRADGDRDQRCRALEDALGQLRERLHLETEQTAALRERVAAEEAKRSEAVQAAKEEQCLLQHSYDALRRQLEDWAVEKQHNEDELREQRAEVTALQRVLAEREQAFKQETEKAVAAVAAREVLAQQCGTLEQQLNFTRGQLESARAGHQRALNEQLATQRTRDARVEAAQAELTTVAAEKRRLQCDAAALENRQAELVKEVQTLRRQEADLLGQLQARKSEISALRERCANLESLKSISEASLAETQTRERGLLDKIEELRNAQQLMQLCFDKQQEQLEIGRRLRQQDAQMRSPYSP